MVVEVTYPPGGAAPLSPPHPVAGAIYIVEGVAEVRLMVMTLRDNTVQARRCRTGRMLRIRTFAPHPDRPLRFLTIYVLERGRSYTNGTVRLWFVGWVERSETHPTNWSRRVGPRH